MKLGRILAAVAATALTAMGMTQASASESSAGAGLWEDTHEAEVTDCGNFKRTNDGFCVADDPVGVELGVRFQITEPVQISGVRVYRADPGALRATLWSTDGNPLAQAEIPPVEGEFAAGWQDIAFTDAVDIPTGTTYIASYYSPNATYAFEYQYFSTSAYESGPLVALQSVQGQGNGVFCYADDCYPDATFRDSNYWVTPLWQYPFQGFSAQVAEDGWAQAKAGRAIPVDFSLGGDYGLGILAEGYPKATRVACPSSEVSLLELESTSTTTAGSSELRFDSATGEYKYVWKTSKTAAGKCYAFQVGLVDGSIRSLNVQFVK